LIRRGSSYLPLSLYRRWAITSLLLQIHALLCQPAPSLREDDWTMTMSWHPHSIRLSASCWPMDKQTHDNTFPSTRSSQPSARSRRSSSPVWHPSCNDTSPHLAEGLVTTGQDVSLQVTRLFSRLFSRTSTTASTTATVTASTPLFWTT
jgi:hypothetical protein